MPKLVVGILEPVEIHDDGRDRTQRLALKPVEFILVECAVMQLGQHIVFAEIFQIGFGFLARGDVGQRHLDTRPVLFMSRQNREMQQDMAH